MSLNDPQPKPVNPTGPPIWELVIKDMRERDEFGTRKYGTPLRAVDGRDHLVDAYQESLDQSVYLRQEIEERIILRAEIERLNGYLVCLRDGVNTVGMHCDPLPPMSSWRYVVDKALRDKYEQ